MLLAVLTGLLSKTMMADELIMKNGSRLKGTLVNARDGEITFDTPFAGVISVKAVDVKRMYTEMPIAILMADGCILRNQRIAAQEDALVMMSADGHVTQFVPNEVDVINPEPWRLGDSYNRSGLCQRAVH